MRKIVSPEQARGADRAAMERIGIPGRVLMERAALAVADRIDRRLGPCTVTCVCGPGNNGGDGFAVARLLKERNYEVQVVATGRAENFSGDALANLLSARAMEVPVLFADTEEAWTEAVREQRPAAVVDALFGTGLSRPPRGAARAAIRWINGSGAVVFAVDIPSGVDGADGSVHGDAVIADETVTFQFLKLGLALHPGRTHAGRVSVCGIGIPDDGLEEAAEGLERADVVERIPLRRLDSHKGTYGKVLIVAGSRGMAGAGVLCARGALRTGAGMVTLALPQGVQDLAASMQPEMMTLGLPGNESLTAGAEETLRAAMEGKDALALGPGLGRSAETGELIRHIFASRPIPFVLDADGLYHASGCLSRLNLEGGVLTPHAGEMARLLNCEPEDVRVAPVECAKRLAGETGAVALLKGSTTVIADPSGAVTLNLTGGPGMAAAGSGDVLTGAILALLGQGLTPYDAARVGAWLHGKAGELAQAELGAAGMTSGDLAQCLALALRDAVKESRPGAG